MRVGKKKGALVGDHQAHRGKIGRAGNKPDDVPDVAQARAEAPVDPAKHGVGVAALHRDRGDHGRIGSHQGARGLGRDSAPAGALRDRLRHNRENADHRSGSTSSKSRAGPHRQAKALEAAFDHLRTADENRLGDALLDDGLGRAQHPFILAFRVDHALGASLGGLQHRLHDEAGTEHEARQCLVVERQNRRSAFSRRPCPSRPLRQRGRSAGSSADRRATE